MTELSDFRLLPSAVLQLLSRSPLERAESCVIIKIKDTNLKPLGS